MKLYPDKLDAHLAKQTAPVYLLHGDEPLQIMEMGDRLREHARQQGFDERQVLLASDDGDWPMFREALDSMSLFAERRLIELRLPTGKPGRVGGDVLKQYCSNPAPDVLLVISSGKLDRSGTSSAWFKAIDKAGVTIAVYPVDAVKLPRWLGTRLAMHGLQATDEALLLIAERVEGNMLAASQEVERLALLCPAGEVDVDQVLAAVADSARYSIGDLVAAALSGKVTRSLRILRGLHDEAVSPVPILWSLALEIRGGTRVAESVERGRKTELAFKDAGIWPARATLMQSALKRHNAGSWLSMLTACSEIERVTKGHAAGDPWDALELLCAQLAGRANLITNLINERQ